MTTDSASLRPAAVGLCILFLAFKLTSCTSSSSSPSTKTSSLATASADVLTFHNDIARTGQYLNETTLTPENVHTPTFGKVNFFTVDGKVDGQPLYVSNVNIAGQGAHPALYVVTEHGSVFAIDANNGQYLWTVSPGDRERPPAILAAATKRSAQKLASPQLP